MCCYERQEKKRALPDHPVGASALPLRGPLAWVVWIEPRGAAPAATAAQAAILVAASTPRPHQHVGVELGARGAGIVPTIPGGPSLLSVEGQGESMVSSDPGGVFDGPARSGS